jgi:hypothetical protein
MPAFTLRDGREKPSGSRRRRTLIVLAAGIAAEVAALRLRGYRWGGNVVVRCRQGHLFTTIWIPAASVKSLRLGLWRVQRCPVGGHWSIVTPVRKASLSRRELRHAGEQRDLRVP